MYYELTPAYGDYKTKAEVVAAFNADKDFSGDYQLNFQTVNRPQLPIGATVLLRYKRNTQVASVKVHHNPAKPIVPKATKQPSIATMQNWMYDGVAKATDGCTVEPDGHCPHGRPSWLLVAGLI